MVRGNHAIRPQNLSTIREIYDKDVEGYVYYEEEYPNIRYFKDYGEYNINGFHCAVIGGAYSVDKYHRLSQHWTWHFDEQLTQEEMENCEKEFSNKYFDFIFSHTCPYSWRPTDLFLPVVDQSTVDTTMEQWLENLKNKITYGVWCFGHYHADRIEKPYAELFYNRIEDLNEIFIKWSNYRTTKQIEWYLPKGPKFYYDIDT